MRSALADRGVAMTGPGETVKARFWSVVRRYPSTAGTVWSKECNPGQAFEGPLLQVLGSLAPDAFPSPLTVDDARGRFLLPDVGPVHRGERTVEGGVVPVLVQVAEVQQRLAASRDALLTAGLPSLTPAKVPDWWAALLEELSVLPPEHPQAVDPDRRRQLHAGTSRVRDWSAALHSSGVADSFQHNDLNPGNVAAAGSGDRLRFFDVGDAFWSHPFAVVQLPLAIGSGTWPWGPDVTDPAVVRALDAYLEPWTAPGVSLRDLRGLVGPALLLAQVHRCESWRRLLAHVPPHRLGVEPPLLVAHLLRIARIV